MLPPDLYLHLNHLLFFHIPQYLIRNPHSEIRIRLSAHSDLFELCNNLFLVQDAHMSEGFFAL
jgi:hypothetical protein